VRASVRCRPGLDWQFCGSHALDEAYVLSVGAFGAAWDDGMVARWSANPLGMLWPEMDAALATSGGENGGPAGRGAAVGRSAGPGPFKRFHIEGFAGRRDVLIEASGGSSISPTAVGPNRNCSMGRGVPKSTA
jgi:hypothetical protein